MKTFDFSKKLTSFAVALELILAVFLAVGILIGFLGVFKYFGDIMLTDGIDTYEIFKEYLGFILLLVVGVEFILMLLSHSTSAVLELVLFAIARKMLVYSETVTDLLIGTVAIAVIFLIKRFLMTQKRIDLKAGHIISAAEAVRDVISFTGLRIPANKGNTLGGLVCYLSKETCIPVEEGAEYNVGNTIIQVLKMKGELIEKVLIKENNRKGRKTEVA